MKQFSNKLIGFIAGFALLLLAISLFYCNVTTEDGHTYIAVANDTVWTKFDRIEIAWKDSISGTGGVFFTGNPSDLKAANKFLADDYKG